MKIIAFLKSPAGSIVLLAIFLGVSGLVLMRSNVRDDATDKALTLAAPAEPGPLHASLTRAATVFKPTPPVPPAKPTPKPEVAAPSAATITSELPRPVRTPKAEAPPPKAKPVPLSLVAVSAPPPAEEPGLSKAYAPFGRLIPCETVITLESSKLDTPVLGLVTEDVWHQGRRIIPAGAEVHGRAALDRSRERIAASGRWVIVWRDASELNGAELALNGIALERSRDDVSGEFGLRDGSAGLVGALLRTDDWQEIKLFAATFLGGLASGLQPVQAQTSALGVLQATTGSARDAALRGTADVLNAYARQIQEAIARDGFFVRVPAGKQFYLYVTETIDQARATRANRGVEEVWRKKS